MRPVQQDADLVELLHRHVDGFAGRDVEAVPDVTAGHDRIEAEAVAEFLAQLADVALDHALVERRFEDAVDRVEDLRLGDPLAVVADHIFENAQFAAGQGESVASDLGGTSVEEDLDPGLAGPRQFPDPAARNRGRSGEDLAEVNRHVDDVVDARFEELQRVLEHLLAAHGDDGSRGALAHRPRQASAGVAIPEEEGVHRGQIRFTRRLQPVPEFSGGEADRRYTFANEPSDIAVRDALAIINDNIHQSPLFRTCFGRLFVVMPGSATVLFDDIPSREPLLWFRYSRAALRIQCLRLAGLLLRLDTERLLREARRVSCGSPRGAD